ncbi:hypothetical protein AA313_de0200387 [Arthrobotrys entomopaga]|nr:hypothetical protein AA313_de0200387 [Arthrobotrys entomopaga]
MTQRAENAKYLEILNHIRNSTNPSLRWVMGVVKSQATVEDILIMLRNGQSVVPTRDIIPEIPIADLTLLPGSSAGITEETITDQMILGVTDDRSVLDVRTGPWTTVDNDNDDNDDGELLASHSISSYTNRDVSGWNLFDMDRYLEGMMGNVVKLALAFFCFVFFSRYYHGMSLRKFLNGLGANAS